MGEEREILSGCYYTALAVPRRDRQSSRVKRDPRGERSIG